MTQIEPPSEPDTALNPATEYLSIPVRDVTFQWGCATGSDLPITPTSESTARMMAERYGHGLVRRPVGPWDTAPGGDPDLGYRLIRLAAYCPLAGRKAMLEMAVAFDHKVPPVGGEIELPCPLDGRHQHRFQVIPAEAFVLLETAQAVVDQSEVPGA